MIAVPIALVLFGYWVMYAGLKRVSLAEAWSCTASSQGQTQTTQSGIRVSGPKPFTPPGIAGGDCVLRSGDTKLPGGFYWHPQGSGVLGQINGRVIGPCLCTTGSLLTGDLDVKPCW